MAAEDAWAGAPRLVLVEASVADQTVDLFPAGGRTVLTREALRPSVPFEGSVFAALEAVRPGDALGLVVPAVWRGDEALIAVRDHVNLALRGPLTGRWPAGVPRRFPCMTGIYQPGLARAAAGAPVYSGDAVVAGVADAGRLTPFERRAIDESGAAAWSDCLAPAVIAAAFYGLKVAACVVARAARERE